MSASHKVECNDGVTRTFHQSGVYTRGGFVYVNHRRVYGSSVEVYTAGKGYHHVFNATGTNAGLVEAPQASEAAETATASA